MEATRLGNRVACSAINGWRVGPVIGLANKRRDCTRGGDCSGTITDAKYNISDDSTCGFSANGSLNNTDTNLDPAGLKNNGGRTKTIALLPEPGNRYDSAGRLYRSVLTAETDYHRPAGSASTRCWRSHLRHRRF